MDNAKEYFKRRIDFLTKQIEKIQPVLQEKYKMKQGKTADFILLHLLTMFMSSSTMKAGSQDMTLAVMQC